MSLENVSLEEMESLANLSKTLADNPSTRRQFLELVKTASPSTSIPEIDMEYRMNETTRPLTDKIASLEAKLQQKEFMESRKEAHANLQKMGIASDKINDVEKLMLEKKIGDFATAGELYLSQQKTAEPSATNFTNKITLPDMKSMGGDIKNWALNEANAAVSELIKARR